MENTEQPYIAGFWRRFIAFFVDILIAGLFCYILSNLFGSWVYKYPILMSLLGYLLVILYFGTLNSVINKGQSFGKMLMSIQVMDSEQQYLSLLKSCIRSSILFAPLCLFSWTVSSNFWISLLSSIILISLLATTLYLYIFNRSNRRTTHDFITQTYVVNEGVNQTNIKPTWSTHYYVSILFACTLTILSVWNIVNEDDNYIPSSLKPFNFKDADHFDFSYVQYSLQNGETLRQNQYVISVLNPKLMNNPHYAEELAKYIYSQEPSLFNKNQENYISLIARYQFGLISMRQTSGYAITHENSSLFIQELSHAKGFSIGSGY